MEVKKYCYKCGENLSKEWNGFYDEETGEKSMRLYCSNLKCPLGCGERGHKWERSVERVPWFGGGFGTYRVDKRVCSRCGLIVRTSEECD